VPGLPCVTLLLLPPHPGKGIKAANNSKQSTYRRVLLRRTPIIPRKVKPLAGNHSAYSNLERPTAANVGSGPVVVTVKVAGVPGATELGLMEHCGAFAGCGDTEHVSETEFVKPLSAVSVTAEVACPPGLTVAGEINDADSEKSGGDIAPNVAVTD